MDEKPFGKVVEIEISGRMLSVSSARQAAALLSSTEWPAHGPRHRDALDACLKVLDGHRSTVDAEQSLVEAAREAGLKVGN